MPNDELFARSGHGGAGVCPTCGATKGNRLVTNYARPGFTKVRRSLGMWMCVDRWHRSIAGRP